MVKLHRNITNRDVAQLKIAPEKVDEPNKPVVSRIILYRKEEISCS